METQLKASIGIICLGLAAFGLALQTLPSRALAAEGRQATIEVLQARATLEYSETNYAKAKATLEGILELDLRNVTALELLALCERRLGDDAAALETYRILLESGPPAKAPSYHFEMGSIEMKLKHAAAAREHFTASKDAAFNPGMSRFFLGLIDFGDKKWEAARALLIEALEYDDIKSVAATARFYVASADEQLGRADAALRTYYEVAYPDADTLTGTVRENALKTLKRLDEAHHFEMVTLLNQYDTNVQANPSDVPNPVAPSFRRSGKTILNAAAGRVTAPVHEYQVAGSLRLFGNYDWNQVTRNFQFASVTPSLLVLRQPYRKNVYGFKLEGTYTMQNVVDVTTSVTNHYESFSLTGDIGPLARLQLSSSTLLTLEATWRPKNFYLDAPSGDTRRTGMGYFLRATADYHGSPLLNLTAYLSLEEDFPQGFSYVFASPGFGVSNAFHLTDKLTLTPLFDYTRPSYFKTINPERVDALYSMRVTAQYSLTAHWMLLADAGYLVNTSTVPELYQYTRTLASLGATYFF